MRRELRVAQRVVDGLCACFAPTRDADDTGQAFKYLNGLIILWRDGHADLINPCVDQQRLHRASKHGLPRK
jgi:hypothetical protein